MSNFDTIGHTIKSITHTFSRIPKHLVHKQLDDIPLVAPKASGWCEEFSRNYRAICDQLNIPLAPLCPKKDKAFENSEQGKVLGIEFNSVDLTWRLPEDKRRDYLNSIIKFSTMESQSLVDSEEILGKLNFVCSMCPLLRTFKKPLQEHIRILKEANLSSCKMASELASDLLVWAAFLKDSRNWLPISPRPSYPPLLHKTYTTDAAGWSADSLDKEVGFGCIGLSGEGEVIFANQSLWSLPVMGLTRDSKKKFLGNKTTTLEFAGILIPFLLQPYLLCNQHVKIQVDNIGCVFAWEKGYSKEDNLASILVRVLVLLSAKLSCVVHIHHHPRNSSWESTMADRLSRSRTTSNQDRKLLDHYSNRRLPPTFEKWMENPIEDWSMPIALLNEL